MRKLLAGIVICAALAASTCNQSATPPAPGVGGQTVPSLPGLAGAFAITFVTEPDGMIRMVMEGENRLTGVKSAGVVEAFSVDAMGHKWRFPTSSAQTIIEAEFEVGQP